MDNAAAVFAAVFAALYVAHSVGDHWVIAAKAMSIFPDVSVRGRFQLPSRAD